MDWWSFWDDPAFWPSFWAELLVGGLIIVGIGGWVSATVSRLQAPKARGMMLVEPTQDAPTPNRLNFRIANTSSITFRSGEVRWELFVPTPPGLHGLSDLNRQTTVEGGELVQSGNTTYMHYSGVLAVPLFGGISPRLFYSDIPHHAEVPTKMYYVISTLYGQMPEKVKRTEDGRAIVLTAGVVQSYSGGF